MKILFIIIIFFIVSSVQADENYKKYEARRKRAVQVYNQVYREYTRKLNNGELVYPALEASWAYRQVMKGKKWQK